MPAIMRLLVLTAYAIRLADIPVEELTARDDAVFVTRGFSATGCFTTIIGFVRIGRDETRGFVFGSAGLV